jgi:hypothetical protein
MLIAKRQDQIGKETEKEIENVTVIGTSLKRGLPAEISGSLETGGNGIPQRPTRGTGLYDVTDTKFLCIVIP